jgi:hypothetical protein
MSATGRRASKTAPRQTEAKPSREKPDQASDALRREAELRWAESERSATHRRRRGQAKSRARAQRRQTDKELKAQVAYLTKKLADTERELAKHLRAKKPSAK